MGLDKEIEEIEVIDPQIIKLLEYENEVLAKPVNINLPQNLQ